MALGALTLTVPNIDNVYVKPSSSPSLSPFPGLFQHTLQGVRTNTTQLEHLSVGLGRCPN